MVNIIKFMPIATSIEAVQLKNKLLIVIWW